MSLSQEISLVKIISHQIELSYMFGFTGTSFVCFFVTFISHTVHIISWEQGYYVLNMSPGPWTSARTLTPSAANTVAL